MNLPINVVLVFYQFHEPFKLVHDSSKLTWHVAYLKWTFTSNKFMNLLNKFHKTFRTLWFLYSQLLYLPSHFAFFEFSLFIGSSFVCIYLEASSHDVKFSLAFHCCTSKMEATSAGSSRHRSKQHEPNVVGVRNLMDLRVLCGCEFNCGKSLAMWIEWIP